MLPHVVQGFLADPVHGHLVVLRQLDRIVDVELERRLVLQRPRDERLDRRSQPEVVQGGRPQVLDRPPRLLQRGVHHLLRPGELGLGPSRVPQVPPQRLEPVPGGHELLGDPVVDLAGQPPPFLLLRLDRPANEIGERGLLLLERAEHIGVLDRRGDQRRGRAKELHIAIGEVAPFPGVHVERADERAPARDERHRQQRGELLSPQLGDVLVAGVGELVLRDDHDLAVLRDPAGDALADPEHDLIHGVAEALRGGAQGQHFPLLVVQVQEARVAARGGHHEIDRLVEHDVQVRARRDRLDHAVEQPVLGLDPSGADRHPP